MAYNVHITRSENWWDEKLIQISLKEWQQHVESDPEMRMDNYAEATKTLGETLRYEREGIVIWTAFSEHRINGNMA